MYSDLGYLLAGAVASRAGGADLAAVVAREVTEPLGIDAAPASVWRHRRPDFLTVAPTETVGWRGGEFVGSVHDENALALSGSARFRAMPASSARQEGSPRFGGGDARRACRPTRIKPTPEEAELVAPRKGGTLRAGFDGRADEGSSARSLLSARKRSGISWLYRHQPVV